MPLDFPLNPVNGQTYETFTYDASIASWRSNPLVKGPAYISDTVPALGANGDLWFNSADGTMFVSYNGNWVESRSDETVTPGSVVQVVHATIATMVTNSTSSAIATGLTASITPKFANSKILVLITQGGVVKLSGNATNWLALYLFRDSTQIERQLGGYTGTDSQIYFGNMSFNYLDSPSTTSAITYSTKFANVTNAPSVVVQDSSTPSHITLMEIAQ